MEALQPVVPKHILPWEKIGWCLLALGGIAAFANAVMFAGITGFDASDYFGDFTQQKQRMFTIPVIGYAHTLGGAFAALIGPFQFLGAVRRRFPRVHVWMGRTYLTCVFFSAIGGLYLSPDSAARNTFGIAFICLALAWLYTGAQAYLTIRRRQVDQHQRWMIRNYALTYAAVTLRLEMPLFIFGFGFDGQTALDIVGWFCWVPNLIIVEMWMIYKKPSRIPGNAAAA